MNRGSALGMETDTRGVLHTFLLGERRQAVQFNRELESRDQSGKTKSSKWDSQRQH